MNALSCQVRGRIVTRFREIVGNVRGWRRRTVLRFPIFGMLLRISTHVLVERVFIG